MKNPTPKLQMYLKNVLDADKINPSKKADLIADKKRKKILEMKEKQKLALENHKVEDNVKAKLDLECIFCKNAFQVKIQWHKHKKDG